MYNLQKMRNLTITLKFQVAKCVKMTPLSCGKLSVAKLIGGVFGKKQGCVQVIIDTPTNSNDLSWLGFFLLLSGEMDEAAKFDYS